LALQYRYLTDSKPVFPLTPSLSGVPTPKRSAC
jgi:hypothetical protein